MMRRSFTNIVLGFMLSCLGSLHFSCASSQEDDEIEQGLEAEQEDDGFDDQDNLDSENFANDNQFENENLNEDNQFANENFGNDNQFENENLNEDNQFANENFGNDNQFANENFGNEGGEGNGFLDDNLDQSENQFAENTVEENFDNNTFADENQLNDVGNDASQSEMPPAAVAQVRDFEIETRSPEGIKNLQEFKSHFASFLAGRPEGVFRVKVKRASVHLGPHMQFEVVEFLPRDALIHAIKIDNGWVKIGRSRYIRIEEIRSLGLKTRGISAYSLDSVN